MYAPHPDRRRDTCTTTDFELVYFNSRQTTGPEFYDRSNLSRRVGLMGVGVAALFGLVCIIVGLIIFLEKNTISAGVVVVSVRNGVDREMLCLALNLMVTACTETTGFVHGIALRSAMASRQRLRFNTNLRLLSAAGGWFSANGTLCSIVMTILLIVSYSSSLLAALSVDRASEGGVEICVSDVPLIVLGVSLILQAIIALISVWAADILTWSSSPFDITAALVHHAQILPELGECMNGVGDGVRRGPTAPSPKQPSAWRAHPSVRKVVITLWVLVVFCIVWGIVVVRLSNSNISLALRSWSFFPPPQSNYIAYSIPLTAGVYWYWLLYYVNVAGIQGPLTLALHCCELIVNIIRDERAWRKATTEKGTTISSYPLAPVFGNVLNVALLISKPLLHWMLGLAISLAGTEKNSHLTAIAVSMWPFQILNYSAALLIFSLTLTVIVLRRPEGPQPAAYGHVQTLANLIDEWSPTMWWGHKTSGQPFYHAGTSDHPLPKVDMNASYA